MKKIIWLDGSVETIKILIKNVINELWKQDGISQICICEDMGKAQMKSLEESVYNTFVQACMNEDAWNYSQQSLKNNEYLFQDMLKCVDKKDVAGVEFCDVDYIKNIFGIKDDTVVLLNIELLENDRKHLENSNHMLSMSIYHKLKKAGINCLLYSELYYPVPLINGWKQKYKECGYGSEDIVIYNGQNNFKELLNALTTI